MPQGKCHVIARKDQFIFKLKYKQKVIFFLPKGLNTPLFSANSKEATTREREPMEMYEKHRGVLSQG